MDHYFSVEQSFAHQDAHGNPGSPSSDCAAPLPPSNWAWGSGPLGAGSIPSVDFHPASHHYAAYPAQQPTISPSPRDNFSALPKVPIPRATSANALSQRRRSARACEPCRQRKVKCDGMKPVCRKCNEHSLNCVYVDIKRVREQKQLGSFAEKVERYEKLLHELESEVEPGPAKRIRRSLRDARDAPPGEDSSDSESSSPAVSLHTIDLINEDLNRTEKTVASGFFGKNSEVAWMQKLEDDAERGGHGLEDGAVGELKEAQRQDIPIMMMNYHLDDLDLILSDSVDPYALPSKKLADQYFAAYMESIHPAFGVIRKTTFTSQYEQFFRQPSNPPHRWLAILNMIFAIGCRYCRLVGRWKDGDLDDLEYLNRARKLSLEGNFLFEHADLQQIQLESLVAVYLLAIGQINRAFKFSSMAFRSAVNLGINLRFVDDRTHHASKEARSRLWWSIYNLENLLTSITGRASGVGEGLSATPLPIPLEEEEFRSPAAVDLFRDASLQASPLQLTLFQTDDQGKSSADWLTTCEPSPSLFFHCLVDLSIIMQAVLNNVYSIQSIRDRPRYVEQRIQKYALCVAAWLRKIPEPYRFTVSQESDQLYILPKSGYMRERVTLAVYYYSARIILYRPCLSNSPSLSLAAQRHGPPSPLRTRMTLACLCASCSLLSILPDHPDTIWLITVTPWWAILHFIMQATTALLIGLSSWPAQDGISSDPDLPSLEISAAVSQTKKALRWLYHMSHTSTASRRAFALCEHFLRRIAPSLGLDISDIPESGSLAPPFGDEGVNFGGMNGVDLGRMDLFDSMD